MTLVSRGVALVALVAAAVGCADGGGTTGPSEEHPAIPQFAEAACAVWSCSIGDCTYDPAIYGACCVEVAEGGLPVASRPSCEGPPPGGGDVEWCSAGDTQTACLIKRSESTGFYGNCYESPYSDPGTGNGFVGDMGDYFSECS